LYQPKLAAFTMCSDYDQKHAVGFMRILGLPARSQAKLQQEIFS